LLCGAHLTAKAKEREMDTFASQSVFKSSAALRDGYKKFFIVGKSK